MEQITESKRTHNSASQPPKLDNGSGDCNQPLIQRIIPKLSETDAKLAKLANPQPNTPYPDTYTP